MARWSERHVLASITLMVVLGLGIGIGLWSEAVWSCIDDRAGWWFTYVCSPLQKNPPWTILTGLVAGPALLLTWYWRTTQRFREIRVSESQEVTSGFARAVELLGNDNLAQCLGGIYALGRLAESSEREASVVIETLCAFVRSTPTHPYSETTSIAATDEHRGLHDRDARMEAAIRVLTRLNKSQQLQLFLNRAQLDHIHIPGADFSYASLRGASLTQANLRGTDFDGALLGNCNFARADLRNCSFAAASLAGADLRGAILSSAHLDGAMLSGAVYDDSTQLPDGFDPNAAEMKLRPFRTEAK